MTASLQAAYELQGGGEPRRSGPLPAPGPMTLPAALYTVKVTAPSCTTFSDTVRVRAGASSTLSFSLFCP